MTNYTNLKLTAGCVWVGQWAATACTWGVIALITVEEVVASPVTIGTAGVSLPGSVVFNHLPWMFIHVCAPFQICIALDLLVPRLDGKSISASVVTFAGPCFCFLYHIMKSSSLLSNSAMAKTCKHRSRPQKKCNSQNIHSKVPHVSKILMLLCRAKQALIHFWQGVKDWHLLLVLLLWLADHEKLVNLLCGTLH